eukprot:6199948-Pleurochrysis_carterae.AAC.2
MDAGTATSAGSAPTYFMMENTAAQAAPLYPGSATSRATVCTPSCCGGNAALASTTSARIRGKRTAASAALRPASPASVFSAVSLHVALGTAGSRGAAARGATAGDPLPLSASALTPPAWPVLEPLAPAAAGDIPSTMRLVAAAQPSGGLPPHERTTPAAARVRSRRQSSTVVATAVSDDAASRESKRVSLPDASASARQSLPPVIAAASSGASTSLSDASADATSFSPAKASSAAPASSSPG